MVLTGDGPRVAQLWYDTFPGIKKSAFGAGSDRGDPGELVSPTRTTTLMAIITIATSCRSLTHRKPFTQYEQKNHLGRNKSRLPPTAPAESKPACALTMSQVQVGHLARLRTRFRRAMHPPSFPPLPLPMSRSVDEAHPVQLNGGLLGSYCAPAPVLLPSAAAQYAQHSRPPGRPCLDDVFLTRPSPTFATMHHNATAAPFLSRPTPLPRNLRSPGRGARSPGRGRSTRPDRGARRSPARTKAKMTNPSSNTRGWVPGTNPNAIIDQLTDTRCCRRPSQPA